jgi:mono/diheme cytochrome c family protein
VRGLRGSILAVAAAFVLAGCGAGGVATGRGDVRNGATLFQAKCAGCHALAAASAQGTTGPNLDAAFGADRQQGFAESTILNVVLEQMRVPSPPMPDASVLFPTCQNGTSNKPQGCVTDQKAALLDVASYVASTAGVNGPEAKAAAGGGGTNGKSIFTANCASCHTLAAAGAAGTIGPNLDKLKPPLAIVIKQVTNGGSVMPAFKGKLTAQQIDAVSKFVAANAGK